MMSAVRHRPVDRCPYATYNLHPYLNSPHAADPSYAQILALVEATAGMAVKSGAGGIGVGLSRPRPGQVETATQETTDGRVTDEIIHTPKGDLIRTTRAAPDGRARVTRHFVSSDDDIEKLLSLPYEPPELDTSGIRAMLEAVGDRGIVFAGFDDPMYSIASLFHFEDFCVRVHTDLAAIKRMVDWAFERCAENTKLLVRACTGLDCVFHTSGPELCTPPMTSPDVFAKLVTPYLRALIDIIHASGFLAAIHCHGRVREVLPHILDTGADLLEPIEPPPQGDITLAELLGQAGDRICLMGHVQDQDFYTAPPGYMTRWVQQIAATVGGRTGYTMTPTCTPFEFPCSDTYRRNYIEWLEAADRLL